MTYERAAIGPNLRFVAADQSGHSIMDDQPDLVFEVVERALDAARG